MRRILKEYVVLVNKDNKKIGIEEKIQAHQEGNLHRAISVFIFNSHGDWLLQQRAKAKYHSGGLWSNTVCSHPRPHETFYQAAHRRLQQEMGFDCKLKKLFCFIYRTAFLHGLTENEYDCVFVGRFDGIPRPNPQEVMNYQWVSLTKLQKDIIKHPYKYSFWLKKIYKRIKYSKVLIK